MHTFISLTYTTDDGCNIHLIATSVTPFRPYSSVGISFNILGYLLVSRCTFSFEKQGEKILVEKYFILSASITNAEFLSVWPEAQDRQYSVMY